MTRTQDAIDRALLGLQLTDDEAGQAMVWLAAEVVQTRTRGEAYVELPSTFDPGLIRRAMHAGLVDHFRNGGPSVRLFLDDRQPSTDGIAISVRQGQSPDPARRGNPVVLGP